LGASNRQSTSAFFQSIPRKLRVHVADVQLGPHDGRTRPGRTAEIHLGLLLAGGEIEHVQDGRRSRPRKVRPSTTAGEPFTGPPVLNFQRNLPSNATQYNVSFA